IRYPHSTELPRDQVRPLNEDLSQLKCVIKNSALEELEEIRGFLAHAHPHLSMGELIGIMASEFRERHHPEAKAKRVEARMAKKAKQPTAPRVAENMNTSESPTATRVVENNYASDSPAAPRADSSEDRRHPSQKLTHLMILKYGYRCSYVDPMTG